MPKEAPTRRHSLSPQSSLSVLSLSSGGKDWQTGKMRGTTRTLLLLIVAIQACNAIRVTPREQEVDEDGCIEQVVMTEEESAEMGTLDIFYNYAS